MTGFGEGRLQDDRETVTVEVRSVNNRHLKLSTRLGDPYTAMEPEIERLVRENVRRGTVNLSLRVERPRRPEDYRLNLTALESYREQLRTLGTEPDLAALLSLPGVVEDRRENNGEAHGAWPRIEPVVRSALVAFQAARAEEGRAMAAELLALGRSIRERLERVASRSPAVVSGFEARLTERVNALIERHGVQVEPKDLIREVALFAERADIAEEITRLRAHLEQYEAVIEAPESAGRKLEFVVQEMGRETNTIGSKASDIEISREVVEMKGALERIRELIQNVE